MDMADKTYKATCQIGLMYFGRTECIEREREEVASLLK